MTKFDELKKQYRSAVERLDEVLKVKKTDIIRDSAITRFELCFDLAWKAVKAFLEEKKGFRCASPKDCFREAYRQGLIDYSNLWMKETDWRNAAVHTYSEKLADQLFEKLRSVFKLFQTLKDKFEE